MHPEDLPCDQQRAFFDQPEAEILLGMLENVNPRTRIETKLGWPGIVMY